MGREILYWNGAEEVLRISPTEKCLDRDLSGYFSVCEICTGGQFSVLGFAGLDNSLLMSLHSRTNLQGVKNNELKNVWTENCLYFCSINFLLVHNFSCLLCNVKKG